MTPRSHLLLIFFSNTCPTSRVTHQNDRNCSGNIIKFEKKKITFINPPRALFCLLEVIFRSTIAKFSNIPISPWARIGLDALLTHTNFFKALICPKHEMRCYQLNKSDELYILTAFMGVPPNLSGIRG